MLVKKGTVVYSANVGNVLAFLFFSEKIFSYKFDVRQLTYDDSNFSMSTLQEDQSINKNNNWNKDHDVVENSFRHKKNQSSSNYLNVFLNPDSNPNQYKTDNDLEKGKLFSFLDKTYGNKFQHLLENETDMGDEIRRIYEKGGEIRNLSGENVSRIFLKGKYYPGLLNTRSLGDLVGRDVGIISEPHFVKYQCDDKFNYYLIMCTDGISNIVSIEKMVNIIETNDLCK